jgi:pyruvate kinase
MDPKIIATIGPKSEDYETIKNMTLSGMNIARVNFSHASYGQWKKIRKCLARIKKETGIKVEMMMDLQGPRIRVGELRHEIQMNKGEIYAFVRKRWRIEDKEIPIDRPNLFKEVHRGESFYLANGLIELEILDIKNKKIYARVQRGGILLSRKSINIPEANLSGGALTKKDIKDARFGAKYGADYICLSFVQTGNDIEKLRKIIKNDKVSIIGKIERAAALKNLDEIIKTSDVIMVARGDLGIEVPIEELPIIQKEIIRHSHWHHKPAIVATEMLISMMDRPNPTRAEIADIANAIFDGADAVMLSDETASGEYPVEAVKMMKKIAKRADDYFNSTNYLE